MTSTARAASAPSIFAVAVTGIAIFSAMDAVIKGLTLEIGAYTTILWRSGAGVLISGAAYAASRPSLPSRAGVRLHIVRGAVSAVSAVAFFWGLARMPMSQAVALGFIAPLLSLLLAGLLLGERVARTAIAGSLSALTGVVVILIGQAGSALGSTALPGAAAVLFSALGYAYNIVLMRQQALVARPLEVAFSQSLVVSIVLLFGAPFFASVPDASHLPMIVLGALLAVTSLMILAWAYARAEASYLASSEYTAFIWASFYGWLIFGEQLTLPTLVGAGLIVVGCAVATRRKALPTGGIEVGL